MIISKCCCFTIETGGVILATWSAIQMISAIILVPLFWISFTGYIKGIHYYGSISLVLSIAAFVVTLLSMKGIEKRNHRLILPMLILLSVLLILQLAPSYYSLKFTFQRREYYYELSSFQKVIILAGIFVTTTLAVLSVLVFLSLYDLFKNEPRRGQNGGIYQQQFVPTTQNVESHLESC